MIFATEQNSLGDRPWGSTNPYYKNAGFFGISYYYKVNHKYTVRINGVHRVLEHEAKIFRIVLSFILLIFKVP